MEDMKEKSGFIQDERLLFTSISTCITTCEKCIYDTNRLDQKMGEFRNLLIKKNKRLLNHDTLDRIKRGRN